MDLLICNKKPVLTEKALLSGIEGKRSKHNGKFGPDGYSWDGSWGEVLAEGLMRYINTNRSAHGGLPKRDIVAAIRAAADWLDENVEDANA